MEPSERLRFWETQIEQELTTSGRPPGSVRLIPASKTISPERLGQYAAAGLRVFGENRIQEAKAKIPLLPSSCEWHFIGGLQSNKVRDAVSLFHCIHSIDSMGLLEEVEKRALQQGKTQKVLIEVNVAAEASKHGCPVDRAESLVQAANALPHVEVDGLMTVAPFHEDLKFVRPYFRKLRLLREEIESHLGLRLPELSMGMTHDWKVAVAEGSTMIRIGTGLFGMRTA